MKNKLKSKKDIFEDMKLKMVMKIYRISKRTARKFISDKEKEAGHLAKKGADRYDGPYEGLSALSSTSNLMTADEFFGS